MKFAIAEFVLFSSSICCGQSNVLRPQFEVVSVKPVAPIRRGQPRGCSGGPGTSRPLVWDCPNISLADLLFMAYDLVTYQFDPPGWASGTFVAVAALLPADVSSSDFKTMQQSLLQDRFHLAFHWQQKEGTIYDLSLAEGGVKLHKSLSEAEAAELEFKRVPGATIGEDGFPMFPDGVNGLMGRNGYQRWRSPGVGISDLIKLLRRDLNADIMDHTGLRDKYDIDIHWQQRPIEIFPSSPAYQGPDIAKVLQDRLGLTLHAKKGRMRVFVLEHLDRSPSEN